MVSFSFYHMTREKRAKMVYCEDISIAWKRIGCMRTFVCVMNEAAQI